MNLYNIYGLSRSGNHAIIFWAIHNLVEEIENIGHDIHIDKEKKICYINDMSLIKDKKIKENFPTENFKYVIKSYEDKFFQKDTNIVILRDFLNLICSRYKKYHNYKHNICINNNYICDLYYLIEVWKQHAQAPKKTILYNEWIMSKKYRDKISIDKFNIENTRDRNEYIPKIGGGSSFGNENIWDPKTYTKRYSLIDLPYHMKEIILSDRDLIRLNKNIFDIDIYDILENEK